jgi:hypothetical protein
MYLATLGIPPQYWTVLLKDLSFMDFTDKRKTRGKKTQFNECIAITRNPRLGKLYIATSDPTDEGSLAFSCWLLRNYKEMKYRVAFVDAADVFFPDDRKPQLVVIHNVIEDASPSRLEVIRDVLVNHRMATRIVAVAGPKRPRDWCVRKLRLNPTSVFRLKELEQ